MGDVSAHFGVATANKRPRHIAIDYRISDLSASPS